jgi:HEAT repeat protein
LNEQQQSVVAALNDPLEEVRHKAVGQLGDAFDLIPEEILLNVLGDESWRVRKAAAVLVGKFPVDQRLFELLIRGVGSEDNAGLRNTSTEVLVKMGTASIPIVGRMLKSGDRDERKFAADILGEIGSPDAVGMLLTGLSDEDDNVQGASAEALGRIGDLQVIDDLIRLLKTDNVLVQLSCLDALERLGAQLPLHLLLDLYKTRPFRPQVLRLLGGTQKGQDERLMAVLVEGLGSRKSSESLAAAQALASQHQRVQGMERVFIESLVRDVADDDLCDRLRRMLSSAPPKGREAAIVLSGWTGRIDLVGDLIKAADDERFRKQVMDAILAIGDASVDVLIELLPELGRAGAVLAVELLGRFGQSRCIPRVVEMCLSDDAELTETAQRVLGQLGDTSVIPTLVDLLDRRGQMAAGAVSSLILLGDRFHDEVLAGLSGLLNTNKPGSKLAVASVLCGVAKPVDLDKMGQLVADQDPLIRALAVAALARIGESGVIERLRIMLADESPEVRAAAARALGTRPGPESCSALKVALRDREPWVVAEALAGLSFHGGQEAQDAIVPFAQHQDGLVAMEAVKALNKMGWEDPEQALQACRHSDPEVVKEALSHCETWPILLARQALKTALMDSHWDLRMVAVRKIDALGDPECIQMVRKRMVKETDPLVKQSMGRTIVKAGVELI